jgi:polysaccharide deacetylase 2 family uncharacterized protein YibQ
MFVVCGGCRRRQEQPLRAEDIHRITRELVVAANAAAPEGSEVHSEVRAFDKVANSADQVEIRIFAKREGNPSLAQLLRSLGAVATSRGLTQDPQSESGDGIFLNYRHAGIITHTIHIHLSHIHPGEANTTRESDSATSPGNNEPARLAIILDDVGNDRVAAEAIFAMPYPLTISILPNHAHSVDIAEQAHRRGYEVMLHLPMRSLGMERPEAQELHTGMPAADISALMGQFLNNVPGVVGVNNHQGSQSTADRKLMADLMPILRERKLFYIDSRTSTATVAYDTAHRFGVRAGFRNVPFLDDIEEVSAVRKQIELAIMGAAKKKEAIAIGHAHGSTLQALREALPKAKAQGVRLVFVSELVR